jgi:hypothetical protein
MRLLDTRKESVMRRTLCSVSVVLFSVLVLAAGFAGLPMATMADNSGSSDASLIARWYDVRPFLEKTADHDFGRSNNAVARSGDSPYGWEGGGIFDRCEQEEQPKDTVTHYVCGMVCSKEPWEGDGGRATATVHAHLGLLLVRQTQDGHEQVARALADLESRLLPTLACRVRVVQLEQDFLDKHCGDGVFAAQTPEQRTLLEGAVRHCYTETLMTGTNGQGISNISGLAQILVDDSEPVVAENAVAPDVGLGRYLTGFAVFMRPTLLSDCEHVRLGYSLCYGRLLSRNQTTIQSASARVSIENPLERPDFVCDQRGGTATLALGVPTLIAAGTMPERVVNPEAPERASLHVCYLVTVQKTGGDGPEAAPAAGK